MGLPPFRTIDGVEKRGFQLNYYGGGNNIQVLTGLMNLKADSLGEVCLCRDIGQLELRTSILVGCNISLGCGVMDEVQVVPAVDWIPEVAQE